MWDILVSIVVLAWATAIELSASMRYFTRMLLYYSLLLLNALVLIPFAALHPGRLENMIPGARAMHYVGRLLGYRVKVDEPKHLAEERPFVIVANHQHSIDLLTLFELWPVMRKCATVSKKELLYLTGSFGMFAKLCGTIFIDRRDREGSKKTLEDAVMKAKEERSKVWIFPEGTRHHEPGVRTMLPFKAGAFNAAVKAGVPILPVVISHYEFYDKKRKVLESGDIHVRVLDPIETEGISDVERLMKDTRNVMIESLQNDQTKGMLSSL